MCLTLLFGLFKIISYNTVFEFLHDKVFKEIKAQINVTKKELLFIQHE